MRSTSDDGRATPRWPLGCWLPPPPVGSLKLLLNVRRKCDLSATRIGSVGNMMTTTKADAWRRETKNPTDESHTHVSMIWHHFLPCISFLLPLLKYFVIKSPVDWVWLFVEGNEVTHKKTHTYYMNFTRTWLFERLTATEQLGSVAWGKKSLLKVLTSGAD